LVLIISLTSLLLVCNCGAGLGATTGAALGAFGLGLADLVTGDEAFFTSGFAFAATLTGADFLESVFFDGAATFLGAAFTDFFFAVGTVQSCF
jgi:hypothetical protein